MKCRKCGATNMISFVKNGKTVYECSVCSELHDETPEVSVETCGTLAICCPLCNKSLTVPVGIDNVRCSCGSKIKINYACEIGSGVN